MSQQKQAQGSQKNSQSSASRGNSRRPAKKTLDEIILAYVHIALGCSFLASFFEIDNILQAIIGGITRMLNFNDAWVAQADSYIIATFFFVGTFSWLYVFSKVIKKS